MKWMALEVCMNFRGFGSAVQDGCLIRRDDGYHVGMFVVHFEIVTRTG